MLLNLQCHSLALTQEGLLFPISFRYQLAPTPDRSRAAHDAMLLLQRFLSPLATLLKKFLKIFSLTPFFLAFLTF
jgi:hypothetical protein